MRKCLMKQEFLKIYVRTAYLADVSIWRKVLCIYPTSQLRIYLLRNSTALQHFDRSAELMPTCDLAPTCLGVGRGQGKLGPPEF